MFLKPYKKKIRRDALSGIADIITLLLSKPVSDDDDKMHFALLAEIKAIADKKLLDGKHDYNLKLTPAQGFALRILAIDYLPTDKISCTGNCIHQISNEVHQQYA